MAKRDRSLALATLREQGIDPRRVVGFLARSSGLFDELVPATPRELVARFDLEGIRCDDFPLSASALEAL